MKSDEEVLSPEEAACLRGNQITVAALKTPQRGDVGIIDWMDAPVRLCCGQRHFGPVCPDGMVMCCLCFERVSQDKLNVAANGQKDDICNECAAKEGASIGRTEASREAGEI